MLTQLESPVDKVASASRFAAERGVPMAQIAMAYVLAQPFAAFPLVGCANGAEYAANAAALDVALTPAEVAWLESGA